MVFLEYERYLRRFEAAQAALEQALNEQEILVTKTLPRAIRYDKASVQGSASENPMDDYLVEMEVKRIKKRIAYAKQLFDDRERLLKVKENDLKRSTDKLDKVYVHYKLLGENPATISHDLNYSKSQVYRMIESIHTTLRKDATKCDKMRKNMC